MARMTYEQLKQNALALTSLYETSASAPTCFGVPSGNFDGAGMSFGAIQFNIGSGTLQPIMQRMFNSHDAVVRTAFKYTTNTTYYTTLKDVFFNRTKDQQIAWANSITLASNKHKLIEPWNTYFRNLGVTQECINEQMVATQWYFDLALTWFNKYALYSRRGYALMFDIAVQSGGISTTTDTAIKTAIGQIKTVGKTKEQIETEKMQIIANKRADAITSTFQTSYRQRKLAIANGTGWVYNNTLYMDTVRYGMTLDEAFPKTAPVMLYIDAGYGGTDTGGSFTNGTLGKDITLDIALKLRNILISRYTNVDILMSRTSDVTKSLLERAEEAQEWGANYVVSIRLNSSTDVNQTGFKSVAVNNFVDPPAEVFFYQSLVHQGIQEYVHWSMDLGKGYIHDDLVDNLDIRHIVTLNGFITNAGDQALLLDEDFRIKIAEGHAKGLQKAFIGVGMGEAWESVDKAKHEFGVDISSFQNYTYTDTATGKTLYRDLDFGKFIDKGVKYVYVRAVGSTHGSLINGRYQVSASDSKLMQDNAFKQNITQAQAKGLPVGAYYFANAKTIYQNVNIVPKTYQSFESFTVGTTFGTSAVIDSANTVHGVRSLKLLPSATTPVSAWIGSSASDFNIFVKPSTSYIVSFYAMSDIDSTVNAQIKFNTFPVETTTDLAINGILSSNTWKRFYKKVTTPANCSKAILRVDGLTANANIWIDSIMVETAPTGNTVINGVAVGGTFTGTIRPNVGYNGAVNNGEIMIDVSTGNQFTHPNGTVYTIPSGTEIVTGYETATNGRTGLAYIMFVGANTTITKPTTAASTQFIVAKYNYGQWLHDANGTDIVFTPTANDCIVAEIGRTSSASAGINLYHRLVSTAPTTISYNEEIVYDAENQANHFADILEENFGPKKWGDLYPMLDFESYSQMATLSADHIERWIESFKTKFESRIPTKLGLYTGHYFLVDKDGFNSKNNPSISSMPLWVANYAYHNDPFNNRMPIVGDWDYWVMWQYASDPIDQTSWGIATTALDTNYSRHLSYLRKPSKPNVRIDYIDNKLRLNWDALEDKDIVRFEVYRDGNLVETSSPDQTYYLDATVITDRIYSYKLRAIDVFGDMTESNELTVTIEAEDVLNAPAPPTNVIAIAGYKIVDLTWNLSPTTNVSGYNIYQDGRWIAFVNGTTKAYKVENLELDVTYSFTLEASHEELPYMSVQTSPVSATPFIPIEQPNLPENVKIVVENNMDVTITWENVAKISFSHFAVAINGVITYNNLQEKRLVLKDIPTNTLTTVNIYVYNIADEYVVSEDSVFTILYPSSPRDLEAIPFDKEITLRWTANNESFIKGYNLFLNGNFAGFTEDTQFVFKQERINTKTDEIIPLTNGILYELGVKAVSTQSDIESTMETVTSIPIRVFPNPPTYVAIEVLAENQIKVSWQYVAKERFSHFALVYNGEIVADNLTEQKYTYTFNFPVRSEHAINVVAYDTDGDTTTSRTEFFRIEKPSVPIGLKVKSADRRLIASWFPNAELYVQGYEVYLNGIFYASTENTTLMIEGLNNGEAYSVKVQAKGEKFNSELSGSISGTPVLDIPNTPRIVDYRVLGTGEVELFIEHTQKVDHSHYELFREGTTTPDDSSTFKSVTTSTISAGETYYARVQAVDLDGDRSELSEIFQVSFTAETLQYIQDNTLALGQIDETAKPIKPIVFLSKPNKQTIGVIADIKDLLYSVRMGELNEISFQIPFMVDRNDELVRNPLIDNIRERFLVRIELNGSKEYFLINNIKDNSGSDGEYREVHGFSLGYELSNFQVKEYKKTGYAKEVLEEVLAETSWQLATNLKDVDSYFNTSSDMDGSGGRTFDVSSMTVLEFVKQVADAFGAVIIWNTETRSIDFKKPDEVGENKGFRISYDKYLKSLSKEVDSDQMVTRLYPLGEENLTIREINPTQSPYIEDFSHFLFPFERDENRNVIQSSYYMTDDLAHAIMDYQAKVEAYNLSYSEKYIRWKALEREKTLLQNELDTLELERDIVQGSVDRLKLQNAYEYHEFTYNAFPHEIKKEIEVSESWVAICKISDTSDFTVIYEDNTIPMVADTWTILGRINGIDEMNVKFEGTNPNVYVEMYFIEILKVEFETANNDQDIFDKYLLELSQAKVDAKEIEVSAKQEEIDVVMSEIREIVFTLSLNENFTEEQLEERKLFIITREFNNQNISNAEELYQEALKEFQKLRTPLLSISIDILNFLELVEAQNDWDKLSVGDVVRIFDDRLKVDYTAKILEIVFNYDETGITLQIANADEIKTDQERFMDNLYKAVSTSTTVESRKAAWDKVEQNSIDIESWFNNEIDATKQKIIAGTNESIEISNRGLLIKDKNDKENFIVAQHKVIAITNDGGKTYKNAITTEGVIGERIIGKIIAGENLVIENSEGTFRIDRDGVLIKSFALRIEGGIDERSLGIDTSGTKSSYEDWNKGNNFNSTTPSTPTILIDGTAIDHVESTEGTVDISFSWEYDASSVEGDIDGFMIYIHASTVNLDYEFGVTPSREVQFNVNPLKRSIILRNVSKDLYYSFGVEAYRMVDKTINVTGILKSSIVKPQLREEKPYIPRVMKSSDGSIYATIDPTTSVTLNSLSLNALRQGVSYNNVTIDANVGLLVKNSQDTTRAVMNATDGISIYTRKDPTVPQFDKVFYVDTNGRLTAEKLIAKALEIYDKNGRKIIDANEGILNLRNLNRIEGQEVLNQVTIGAETIFESGYNPKVLGTLYLIDSPKWDSSYVYHNTAVCGLHLQAYGDLNISSCKMYANGTVTGTIVLRRKDTGATVKSVPVYLTNGENIVVLDMFLEEDVGAYWLGISSNWVGGGVSRNTNTVVSFPYNGGDFVVVKGGTYDGVTGSDFYYYFYDFLVSGKGVRGYLANDKFLETIRVKGTTLIHGGYIQTGTISAEAVLIKGHLNITRTVNGAEVSTLKVESDGTVTVQGNIFMDGGNISWGLDPDNQNNIKGFAWLPDPVDGIDKLFIDADFIQAGTMSFDRARGGTLTVGGLRTVDATGKTVFENGIFTVRNSEDEEIATLNGDYGGFGELKITYLKDTVNVVKSTYQGGENLDTSYNLVYYVDSHDGSDSSETLGTSDDPLASISAVIQRLPKYLERDVYIFFVPTLLKDSEIEITGFMGSGTIYLRIWPLEVRYIRDYLYGSTSNTGNHWIEIDVLNKSNVKIGSYGEKNMFNEHLDNIKNKVTPVEYVNGVAKGGAFTGDFILNQSMDGTANNGEVRVDTSVGSRFFHPNGIIYDIPIGNYEISCSMEDGTPARDGYIMFIGTDSSRFAFPYAQDSRDFVHVIYEDGQWKWDNNSVMVAFTPNANDCLIARLGRSSATASGIDIYQNYSPEGSTNLGRINDGVYTTDPYYNAGASNNYVRVYLGGGYKDVGRLMIYHYFNDGRTYHGTKTEVSADGIKWFTVFDSDRAEEYKETSGGHLIWIDKATLRGSLTVARNSCQVYISGLDIDARGTGRIAATFEHTAMAWLEYCLITGDRNVDYAVFAQYNTTLMCWRNEINYARYAGIAARNGAKIEVYDVKGAGYPYGIEAVNVSWIAGGHNAPVGDTAHTNKVSGGSITGTWTANTRGEFSPQPAAPPPPPPPTVVTRTKTWYSTGGDSWNENSNGWHTADDDVLQGKYSSYGLYRGLWFFPADMRNTCVNAISIKQVRVYITRANASGNVGGATHQLRTHGYTSRPSSRPNVSSEAVNFTLSRGQSTWLDITGTFAGHFKGGGTYGIGLYTTSTSSSYYTRCSNVARIEITYTENA